MKTATKDETVADTKRRSERKRNYCPALDARTTELVTRSVTVLCVTLALAGCKGGNPITGSSNIEYRVSGTATRGSITYQNSSGGTSQTTDTVLPWSYSLTAHRDDFLYVSVQNSGREGCVRAEIYRGDRLLESGFSCGAFVIATASASAP